MEQPKAFVESVNPIGSAMKSAANAGADRGAEVASNYCPRCSARLAARSCKLICPGCGYYMSCSDFY